jgi:hypothetical protein
MYNSTLPLTSELDGGWVFNATPRPIYPRERFGTHCIAGWLGPRAVLDGCGKSRSPPGFDPRIVQSVANGYTVCAIPAGLAKLNLRNHIHSLGSGSIYNRFEMWQQCKMRTCQVCIQLGNEQLCNTVYR